jgi:hypothetical protein
MRHFAFSCLWYTSFLERDATYSTVILMAERAVEQASVLTANTCLPCSVQSRPQLARQSAEVHTSQSTL